RTEWEGFATATRAAAAGGVTTICDMPLNSLPPTTSVAALEEKRAAAAGKCWVDVAFWGGAVPGNEASLRPLHEAGVVGFKCFLLDSGVPEFPPLDAGGLRTALGTLAEVDALLIAHAEDAAEIKDMKPGSGRDFGSFVASRPPVAERRAIEKVISAAAATGARAHIVHLPALPVLRGRAGARRGDRVQVLPADQGFGQPGGAVARARGGRDRLRGVRSFPLPARAEVLRLRGFRRGLGWHRLASARPVRGVDGCSAPRPDAGRHGRVDGVRPGRARGPAGQGAAGGWRRRGPGGLRPRRDVRRRSRRAAAQAPGHPVRREDADRTREADVAARHAAAG